MMTRKIAARSDQSVAVKNLSFFTFPCRRVKRTSKKITSNDQDSNRLPIHHYRYFYPGSLVMRGQELR